MTINKAEGHSESRNEAARLQAPAKDQTLAKAIDLRDQIKRLLTADFMAFNELPESREEIARLHWAIDATLYGDFWGQLSEAERSLCKTDYIPRYLHDKWNRHIVEAAQQYDFDYEDGWRSIGEGARWAIRLTGLPPGSELTPDADRGAVVDRKRPKHW